MTTRKQFKKWGMIALAALCVLLVVRLVSEIKGNPTPADEQEQSISRLTSKPASSEKGSSGKGNDSVKTDHPLRLPALEKYVSKSLSGITRNPFDFGPPPLTPAQRAAQIASAAAGPSSAARPVGIPLRAIGYSERVGIGPEAYLTDSDQVYVVHDGDVISQRYKIVGITSSVVEVQDGVSGQRSQLPIPLVQ
jgi:hypothetical protein